MIAYGIFVMSVFVSVLVFMIFVRTKANASYKKNSHPILFRLAVAIWATACIIDVTMYIKNYDKVVVVGAKTLPQQPINRDLVIGGFLILAGIYIFGKSEWSHAASELIGAWRGKDIDNSTELLIEHGLNNPKDREFVAEILRIKFGREEKNNIAKLEVIKEE